MLSPVLRNEGDNRLVYSTSLGFRLTFFVIALAIFLTIFISSNGAIFDRSHIAAFVLCGICLLSSLYLERWVFDKESSVFEINIGLLFLYKRKSRTMDALKKVVLDDSLRGVNAKPKKASIYSRRTVSLYLMDWDGRVDKMDIVRKYGVRELKNTAEKLSAFCGVPLEDNVGDVDDQKSLGGLGGL